MEPCEAYEELMSLWIDGLLPEEDRRRLMDHLAECPDCRRCFADLTAIHDAMDPAPIAAPADFAGRVMDQVRGTPQERPRTVPFPRWRRWAALAACSRPLFSRSGIDGMADMANGFLEAYQDGRVKGPARAGLYHADGPLPDVVEGCQGGVEPGVLGGQRGDCSGGGKRGQQAAGQALELGAVECTVRKNPLPVQDG